MVVRNDGHSRGSGSDYRLLDVKSNLEPESERKCIPYAWACIKRLI